jgi:hypothetical protein
LPGLAMAAAGVDGVWACTAGAVAFEAGVGCAAIAVPAIKLVASSAAANFLNILFSCFRRLWGMWRHCRGDIYTPATERDLKRHAD